MSRSTGRVINGGRTRSEEVATRPSPDPSWSSIAATIGVRDHDEIAGVTDAQIDGMLINNPKTLFDHTDAY